MKAIIHEQYGPLGKVLRVGQVDQPVAGEGAVLIRVHAASIHIGDCHGMRGVPYVMRPIFGIRRPKARVPGTDLAGVVEAVGEGVTRFEPGDEVFGWGEGAFAEYALASEGSLLPRPSNLTLEQAAAVGVSAMTALVGIRDVGKVQAGQKVLVNGASGGVGTYAVQVAKALGAEVTGVCSGRNAELVRSIGADHVIDYTAEDFTKGEPRYDLILDNVGNHPFTDTRRALAPGGTLLSNGAPVDGWFGGLDHVIEAMVQSMLSRKQGRPFVALSTLERLQAVKDLVEAGQLSPVIAGTYPLDRGIEAILHVVDGHARGTAVIIMQDEAG
jgi:NADPH:quinone reductase-like Zn-dependent oxidoreductase